MLRDTCAPVLYTGGAPAPDCPGWPYAPTPVVGGVGRVVRRPSFRRPRGPARPPAQQETHATWGNTMCQRLLRALAVLGGLLVGGLLLAPTAFASDFPWSGAGLNDTMTNGANWLGNVPPPTDGTADLIFAGSSELNPFNDFPG